MCVTAFVVFCRTGLHDHQLWILLASSYESFTPISLFSSPSDHNLPIHRHTTSPSQVTLRPDHSRLNPWKPDPHLLRNLAGRRTKVPNRRVNLVRRTGGIIPVPNTAGRAAGGTPPVGELDARDRERQEREDGVDGERRRDTAERDVVVATPELEVVDLVVSISWEVDGPTLR